MTNVWNPQSVVYEPQTYLSRWRVYSVPFGDNSPTIHFVGDVGFEGRVSSPIVSYDKEKQQGTSSSGRIYTLVGKSGYDTNAFYVWYTWCRIYNVIDPTDVTELY